MKGALAKDDVLFGTVDTWLLHKFSAGKLHLTDISNAAATGYYYFKFVLIFVK
jgi:glycerol kinase